MSVPSLNSSWLPGWAWCLAFLWLIQPVSAQIPAGSISDAEAAKRVVVLPFANISGQAADAWIGRGIADTVAADLERARALLVVRPETAADEARRQGLPFSEDDRSATELSRRLDATWLVTGGYQRLGDHVRITARVLEIETGLVKAALKIDGMVGQIFELQDRIVRELGVELTNAQAARLAAAGVQKPAGPRGGSQLEPVVQGRASAPVRADAVRSVAPAADPRAAGGGPLAGKGGPPAGPAEPVAGGFVVDAAPPGEPASGDAPSAGILTGRPIVSAIRTSEPPRIDGRLDDPAWRTATRVTDFVQQQPIDGAPATEQTEVYVSYDSRNLYFGIYAHYSDPNLIRANRADRDQIGRDDVINIYFDPFLDQQRAYVFSVNGYGVQGDSLMSGGGGGGMMGGGGGMAGGRMPPGGMSMGGGGGMRGGGGGGGRGGMGGGMMSGLAGDPSWDALFESAGTLVADGWTAELAIPFKSLRYPARERGEMHRWGFQIQRDVKSKDESVVWAPVSRDVMGFLRQMGVLEGLTNLSTSRNLEILPTFTGVQVGNLSRSTGSFDNDDAVDGGLNVKYGITSNLTFDFTYNPDFSQVETDQPQIEVNQRFPLFYPELRPFFLEGQEIFNVPGPVTFIHTRTIVDPKFGAKLTGKMGKMTLGALVANDGAPGNVDDSTDPAYGQTAQFLLGRVRFDMYSESHIGLIFTDREFLETSSRVGGLDSQFAIGRNYRLFVNGVFSDRVDAEGVRRQGHFYDVGFRKEGRQLGYSVISNGISPEFQTDAGFIRRVDQRQSLANVTYRWWPQSWIINWGPTGSYERNYTFDGGVLQDEIMSGGVMFQFAKNILAVGNFGREMERFGGIEFWKTRKSVGAGINSSRRFTFGGFVNIGDQVRYVTDPFAGKGTNWFLFMNLRPSSRFQSDINIITTDFYDPRIDQRLFDVKIGRARTTFQFTDRFVLRNILEYNTFDRTLGGNFLLTYRINSGTVFYVGVDDRYRQENRINDLIYSTSAFRRTNRAIFTKLQYLFRY